MRRLKTVKAFLIFFLLFVAAVESKPPTLTPRDTKKKIGEILKAHVSHQQLTAELVKRAFNNYLDEIDPTKTYLTESEVFTWSSPSDAFLKTTLDQMQKEDFSAFEQLHEVMLASLSRRASFEDKLSGMNDLPKGVKGAEFKDLKWTQNEEELFERIVRIKAFQFETADKLSAEAKEQLCKRMTKRRVIREQELVADSAEERKQMVLALVLKATSSSLDSQTAYFTPAEANQFMIQVQQRLFGIGAQLRDDLNGLTIVRLLEGGPAIAGNKVKLNDRIIAVNGEPVIGMEISEAVELIRGPEGTPVSLTLLREKGEGEAKQEEKLEIEIVRSEVVLKESRLEAFTEPFGDGVIGIFHLFSFYQDAKSSSATDLLAEIEKVKKTGNLKGVVLDLRNNAGGLLPQSVAVAGLFISKGVVVSVKDNTGQVQHLRNVTSGTPAWSGPLIVLTNRTSASAAEIVAQTLQDYGRTLIVGDTQTYGKGTFQTFTLEATQYGKVNPKGEYKVTRGRYYTVSGKSPQLVGVRADIVVPGIFEELEIGEKYSRFPLETDAISPNFDDDMADIPMGHRTQLMRLYKNNLQPVLSTYTSLLPTLRQNSEKRIVANPNYQNFLKELQKKEHSSDTAETFGQSDLQLTETLSILKDLIHLLSEKK
jgi:carboxyl-terminal processing protease